MISRWFIVIIDVDRPYPINITRSINHKRRIYSATNSEFAFNLTAARWRLKRLIFFRFFTRYWALRKSSTFESEEKKFARGKGRRFFSRISQQRAMMKETRRKNKVSCLRKQKKKQNSGTLSHWSLTQNSTWDRHCNEVHQNYCFLSVAEGQRLFMLNSTVLSSQRFDKDSYFFGTAWRVKDHHHYYHYYGCFCVDAHTLKKRVEKSASSRLRALKRFSTNFQWPNSMDLQLS